MFRSKTLFIIGAGAGHEAKMPLGSELLSKVAKLLDIRYERGSRQISGSHNIPDALRTYIRNTSNGRDQDINPYLQSAWTVREAARLAKSIDDVLFRLEDDAKAILCGKLAIAECILASEKSSCLYIEQPHEEQTFNYEILNNSWLVRLSEMLCQEVPRKNIEAVFDNISVISFNYDRCIKHFLRYGLATCYNLPLDEIDKTLEKFKIIYPYGDIACLEFEDRSGLKFGAEVNSDRLLEIASRLRTYTEQNKDQRALAEISGEIMQAEKIVFLGFGYHPQNVDLLRSVGFDRPKLIFGTTLGISDPDVLAITARINDTIKPKMQFGKNTFRFERLACVEFFDNFSRVLSN